MKPAILFYAVWALLSPPVFAQPAAPLQAPGYVSRAVKNFDTKMDLFDHLFALQAKIAGKEVGAFLHAGLNPYEKEFFRAHPMGLQLVREATYVASTVTKALCGGHGDNDPADAVRHFAMACYLSSRMGSDVARKFMTAHEYNISVKCSDPNSAISRSPAREETDNACWHHTSRMDLYNNEIGLECGELLRKFHPNEFAYNPGSKPQIRMREIIKSKLKEGKLSVIGGSFSSVNCGAPSGLYPNNLHEEIPLSRAAFKPRPLPGSSPTEMATNTQR